MSTGYLKLLMLLSAFSLLLICCKHSVPDATFNGNGDNDAGNGTGGGSSAPCDPSKIYFQQQVLPILISNCAMSGCHDDASHQDGVVLTSYEKVMSTGDVRPGRPGSSNLYEVIIETDPDDRMPRPPRSPLTSAQIQVIYQWIQQGALNLTCENMCDSTQFAFNTIIKPIITNKCQGCHSGSAASGGIDLSTYNGVKAKITDGKLWGSVNHLPGYSPMPKNGAKLSDCEITQIKKWIENGSLNN